MSLKHDMFSAEYLQTLVTGPIGNNIKIFDCVSSTNSLAKIGAAQGEPHGTIYLAQTQQGGRGRRDRKWVSPKGGLWFSVIVRPQIVLEQAPLLTLLCAVALCQAVNQVTKLSTEIKWPNDVLIKGAKFCGVLLELNTQHNNLEYCVMGIGINANFHASCLPSDLMYNTTTLMDCKGEPIDLVNLFAAICNRLSYWLEQVPQGWQDLLDTWKQNCMTLGQPVHVISATQQESFVGMAKDIDKTGALLVCDDTSQIQRVLAGDVSIRFLKP